MFFQCGKGGVKPAAAAQPEVSGGEIRLQGGNWRLQRASEVEDSGETMSVCGYDDSDWLVATVPGTVATSYYNAGAIPDIRYDDNQLQVSESFFLSDFWYRNVMRICSLTTRRTMSSVSGTMRP